MALVEKKMYKSKIQIKQTLLVIEREGNSCIACIAMLLYNIDFEILRKNLPVFKFDFFYYYFSRNLFVITLFHYDTCFFF